MKALKVVNLFGGPGVGKSVLSTSLFAHMKRMDYNVEYVSEYAKDMVWERRDNILADQLYMLAKQNRRLRRLQENGVEWAVTDGAILNGIVYAKQPPQPLLDMISYCHGQFDNYDVLLERSKSIPYQPEGRIQKTLEEAQKKDKEIADMLDEQFVKPIRFRVGYDSPATLLWDIHLLGRKKEE